MGLINLVQIRLFRIGANSQGILLLPKKIIRFYQGFGDKSYFTNLILKFKSFYNYFRYKSQLKNLEEPKSILFQNIAKKYKVNLKNKSDIRINYILSSPIDKDRKIRVFQIYGLIQLKDKFIYGVVEKTISLNIVTPWRFIGFL